MGEKVRLKKASECGKKDIEQLFELAKRYEGETRKSSEVLLGSLEGVEIAKLNGKVVGYIRGKQNIYEVFVDGSARNKGIGREMLVSKMRGAWGAGRKMMTVPNMEAGMSSLVAKLPDKIGRMRIKKDIYNNGDFADIIFENQPKKPKKDYSEVMERLARERKRREAQLGAQRRRRKRIK